jgi:hypothetical protein
MKIQIACPHCKCISVHEINPGNMLAQINSAAKDAARRANGKLGGRPRKPASVSVTKGTP